MTTEEKVDIICQDFLDRNNSDYTHKSQESLGWESSLQSGEAYSKVLFDCTSTEDFFKAIYDYAKGLIVSMDTPFKVSLSFTKTESYTDSIKLAVATKMFDDERLSTGQALDVFSGLTVHECSHLKYTHFNVMGQEENEIIRNLFNIIEDERIEMLTGEEFPGFANFLACTKRYYFGKYIQKQEEIKTDDLQDFFNCILLMIRYPESIDREIAGKHADNLLSVREALQPYPQSTEEAMECARKIYSIIKQVMKDEEKEQEEKNKKKEGQQKETQSKEKETEKSDENKLLDRLKKQLKELQEMIPVPPTEGIMENVSEELTKDYARMAKAICGELEIGKQDKVNIYHPKSNKDAYLMSYDRIKAFIPAMKTALRSHGSDRQSVQKGLKSGLLDTSKIVEAIQGVESVYMRESVSKADRMTVCVLIDESGSMDGVKINAARDAAVLLKEAMKDIQNIDLFIYGHTTESRSFVKLNAYQEGKGKEERYALGSINADWSNIDSKAIREAAGRVRAKTKEKCLFFVISDGMPCEPTENVRQAVKDLSKDGFTVVSIGIEFEYDPSLMYENHLSLTDMSRLAPELGKVIRKAILKNTKRN